MALFAPLPTRRRILGFKVETTVGTAEVPTATDAVTNCYNVELQSDAEVEERDGQGSFSPLPAVPGPSKGTLKFKTDIIGGASLPPWMATLMAGCAWGATSLVIKPETNMPGVGKVKSLTFYSWQAGMLKTLYGAMGDAILNFPAGKKAFIEWTFQGIYDVLPDAALPTPTFVTTAPLKMESSGIAIGSFTPRISLLQIMLGNDVQMREDGTTGGYLNAYVAKRRMTVKIDPESSLVANNDVWSQFRTRAEQALSFALGTTGNAIAVSIPKLQFTKLPEGDRNGLQVDQIEAQCNRSASAGDDECTITSS